MEGSGGKRRGGTFTSKIMPAKSTGARHEKSVGAHTTVRLDDVLGLRMGECMNCWGQLLKINISLVLTSIRKLSTSLKLLFF